MLFTESREDREVIEMVNRHHLLNTTTSRTIGYFVPAEQAQRIAVQRATVESRRGGMIGVAVLWVAATLCTVLATVGLMG